MKKLLLFSFLLPTFVFANPFLKDMLVVNKQWANNSDGILLLKKISKLPDEDGIISHLMLVEKTLRARQVNHLSETQKLNRSKYLSILNNYWRIGRVPTNDYSPGRFPIFIDRNGVHCAVGYLLKQGGFENIAREINGKQKFAYIHQIISSELVQWQHESGLTVDELAWIQPTYPYPGTASQLGSGLNGEVKDIKTTTGKYSLIAAGKFKIEGDTNFVVLAGFDGTYWNRIIKATGIINKINVEGNVITSYGGDISFDNFNKIEIIETDITNTTPKHKLIGDFNDEILDFETYNGKKYVCGKFTGGLAVFDKNNWVAFSSTKINNPNSIRVYNGKLFITGLNKVGRLYSLVSFDENMFDDNLSLPMQANYLQVFNNKLFIGLKYSGKNFTDTLLYFYDGSKLSNFDSIPRFLYGKEIKNIIIYKHKMAVVGDFQTSFGLDFRSDIAVYDSKSKKTNSFIFIDNYINTAILSDEDKITIGGKFNSYLMYDGSFQGKWTSLLGCGIVHEKRSIGIYQKVKLIIQPAFPNPTTGIISFPETGQLFDINGKLLQEVTQGQNDISNLPAGVYIFVSEKTRERIVKQ